MYKFYASGKTNSVILNFDKSLISVIEWYQQLLSESLGKKGKGFFPIISNLPKDNHSLMQLYLDGNKNNFFTIFDVIDQKFQIIFCDPPYKEKKIEVLIKKIIEIDILDKDGIIIIHRKKGDLDNYPKKFKVIDTKSYGLSTFVFGKKSN